MHELLAVLMLLVAASPQTVATGASQAASARGGQLPAPDPNAPPVIDMALRSIRAGAGGSSIAQSAARGDEQAFVYAGLGPCIVGASMADPARENSITWRASGRVRSVERGIAVADVEWQRLEYRPAGVVAGPRVQTTLTLPIGERVAVDFVAVPGSVCRSDGLIFEIGVAPDHGRRLSMSAEGRSDATAGVAAGAAPGGRGGGGGAGPARPLSPTELEAEAERRLQAAAAVRTAGVVTRPMPPREYNVDIWLVPQERGASSVAPLVQRVSQVIGGTGGRFAFPPIVTEAADRTSVTVDISALVIPVAGDRMIVAITRRVTAVGGASVSSGWIEAVLLPKTGDVTAFEIPAPDAAEAAFVPRQGYGLRIRIGHQGQTQTPGLKPADHSSRSATSGSIRDARRAGK